MENAPGIEQKTASAQDCCTPATRSQWLNQRNVLISVALLGGISALSFGWDWLAAAGVASIIIAIAPCLVMCALGLCMSRMSKARGTTTTPAPGPVAQDVANSELLRPSVPESQK